MPRLEDSEFGQAAEVINANGAGPVVLLCEHASNRIPESLNGLGLDRDARESHVAWDPGALDLALILSGTFDAPLVAGHLSRLVYDCNRDPRVDSAMPARSELFDIPGNAGLSDADRAARIEGVYRPFREAVARVLDARQTGGRPVALVTVHSFTPVYYGEGREVEIGILHDEDARLADAMLARAGILPHRRIERNAPYGPEDDVTHSLKLHGMARGLPNVMIEVRNDLLRDGAGRSRIAEELNALLAPALAELGLMEPMEARHA